jgi:hypothetical protein
MVAAAVIAAGVAGAAATTVASNKAASATGDAAKSAAQVQEDALKQQKELSQPYTDLGKQAIPTLENLLGIGSAGPGSQQATLEQTPGYQFAKQQGLASTQAGAASMGLALSGNTLEGLDKFSTGLADQTYGESVNRLMGVAGLGQAAAAGQAANIGAGANNLSNIAMNQGNNLAGIAANQGASYASIAGNLGSAYLQNQTLQGLRNPTPAAAPAAAPAAPVYVDPNAIV